MFPTKQSQPPAFSISSWFSLLLYIPNSLPRVSVFFMLFLVCSAAMAQNPVRAQAAENDTHDPQEGSLVGSQLANDTALNDSYSSYQPVYPASVKFFNVDTQQKQDSAKKLRDSFPTVAELAARCEGQQRRTTVPITGANGGTSYRIENMHDCQRLHEFLKVFSNLERELIHRFSRILHNSSLKIIFKAHQVVPLRFTLDKQELIIDPQMLTDELRDSTLKWLREIIHTMDIYYRNTQYHPERTPAAGNKEQLQRLALPYYDPNPNEQTKLMMQLQRAIDRDINRLLTLSIQTPEYRKAKSALKDYQPKSFTTTLSMDEFNEYVQGQSFVDLTTNGYHYRAHIQSHRAVGKNEALVEITFKMVANDKDLVQAFGLDSAYQFATFAPITSHQLPDQKGFIRDRTASALIASLPSEQRVLFKEWNDFQKQAEARQLENQQSVPENKPRPSRRRRLTR